MKSAVRCSILLNPSSHEARGQLLLSAIIAEDFPHLPGVEILHATIAESVTSAANLNPFSGSTFRLWATPR